MAYRVSLPSGRVMALFFYDGPISQALAFEGLLNNGEAFATGCWPRSPTTIRLLTSFTSQRMAKATGITIAAATWPSLTRSITSNPRARTVDELWQVPGGSSSDARSGDL